MPICLCGGSAVCQTRHRALHMFYPQCLLNPEQNRLGSPTARETNGELRRWQSPGEGPGRQAIPVLGAGRHPLHGAWGQPGRRSAVKELGRQQTWSLRPWTSLWPRSAPSQVNLCWLSANNESRLWRRHGHIPEELRVSNCHFNGFHRGRVSAAPVTIIALHCTSSQGPRRVWACAPQWVTSST